jgi:ABC-2 type transport system permease protein
MMWAKARVGRHSLAALRHESRLKVAVVSVSALGLWIGAFIAFAEAFGWLRDFDPLPIPGALRLGDIVAVRMLAVFSLALFFMLTFSNVLICFSTAYRAKEVRLLLQAPVTVRTFFFARFLEAAVFSSWASAYLGSPLVLAYGLNSHAPGAFYAAALLFYLPFVAIPAAIGSIIAILGVYTLPRLPKRLLGLLGAALGIAFFLYLRGIMNAGHLADENIIPFLDQLTRHTQSELLPSYWLWQGLLEVATDDYRSAMFYFLLLVSNALFLTWLAVEAAERLFYTGWTAMQSSTQRRVRRRGLVSVLDGLTFALREPIRSLALKDIKLFWRDPTQWTQFVIFFGIMALYTANLRNRALGDYSQAYSSWIASLNSGACALILATLTSRFIYPLISLEGRRFWILGLAPITMRQLMWQKFWLSVATTSPFSIGLIVLSARMLALSPVQFGVSLYAIAWANLSLAGLSVGLGSLYPNFDEDNPARVVSGMGGTLNFLMSIAYVAGIVLAQMVVLQWTYVEHFLPQLAFSTALWILLAAVTAGSLLCLFVPMRLGLRNLEGIDF